jgi:tryptophan 2,3-dioxygenase
MTTLDSELLDRLEALRTKYAASGQSLIDFLDGLLEADYITYWDYIRLDSLLSLQQPRTPHHDEPIFIMYHQITELYFKLVLHELDAAVAAPMPGTAAWTPAHTEALTEHVRRCTRYFGALENSFAVMTDGMNREQFLRFRMALIPASGFQSGQYRMIEMALARLNELVHLDVRADYADVHDPLALLDKIYWRGGATIAATGEKTLTLKQFESKYAKVFAERAVAFSGQTVSDRARILVDQGGMTDELRHALRELDAQVNVRWPMQHLKTAGRYLAKQPSDTRATGGTNWPKYLPPKFQLRIAFPFLWTDAEREAWGTSN